MSRQTLPAWLARYEAQGLEGAGGSVASAGVVSAPWYSLEDRKGVVFILNVRDPATAHEMLEKLPLGQAHFMSFELIPIGPLNPLRWLQGMKTMP